jgi:hypothetical protein
MLNKQPIFQPIFGEAWEKLPAVLRQHYADRPFCRDITFVAGEMEVIYSKLLIPIIPLFRLFNVLVPYQGKSIPVAVEYVSAPDSASFHLNRTFYFPGKKPYHFNSQMRQIKNSEVVEFMRFGIGWKMNYSYENDKVILKHKNYVLKIGKFLFPLPLNLILGTSYCEEIALSNQEFSMDLKMRHPLFGVMVVYKGKFKIVSYEQG